MIDSSSSDKKLSALNEGLNEIAKLYDGTAEGFIDIHNECFDSSIDHRWARLCSVYPELEKANKSDRDAIISHLAELHGRKEKKKEEEDEFKHKAYFEKDSNLFLEVLTSDESYKYAHLINGGNVELIDGLEDIRPVELPVSADGDLAKIVQMPDEEICTCELLNAPELLHKIEAHIRQYCDMNDLVLRLTAYYALFTWFYRKVNTVGYLRFLADTGKGKSRMTTVTSDLCFYPLSAAGSGSFSGMMRQYERWHGTLVIDEADMGRDKQHQFTKYINLGFERGKYFILSDKKDPKRQEVFDPFGPKIFGMREPFQDVATEGRLLSISPYETTNEDIPIILDRKYHKETRKLRNEIARFVLEHWKDVDGENLLSFKGLGIEPRLQQLSMPLSAIFQLWGEGEDIFREYVLKRQHELKRERAESWQGSIFNLVLAIASGEEDISDGYSSYYSPDGEIQAVTPSMVAKTMSITAKTATRALKSIGFVVEERYISYAVETGEKTSETKRKKTRAYTVPDQKTWKEILQRYYYTEDENEIVDIPKILKSKKYTSVYKSVPSVLSVLQNNEGVGNRTLGTDRTLYITEGKKIKCACDSVFDSNQEHAKHHLSCAARQHRDVSGNQIMEAV